MAGRVLRRRRGTRCRQKVKDVQFLFVRREQARSIPNLPELLNRLPQLISPQSHRQGRRGGPWLR